MCTTCVNYQYSSLIRTKSKFQFFQNQKKMPRTFDTDQNIVCSTTRTWLPRSKPIPIPKTDKERYDHLSSFHVGSPQEHSIVRSHCNHQRVSPSFLCADESISHEHTSQSSLTSMFADSGFNSIYTTTTTTSDTAPMDLNSEQEFDLIDGFVQESNDSIDSMNTLNNFDTNQNVSTPPPTPVHVNSAQELNEELIFEMDFCDQSRRLNYDKLLTSQYMFVKEQDTLTFKELVDQADDGIEMGKNSADYDPTFERNVEQCAINLRRLSKSFVMETRFSLQQHKLELPNEDTEQEATTCSLCSTLCQAFQHCMVGLSRAVHGFSQSISPLMKR